MQEEIVFNPNDLKPLVVGGVSYRSCHDHHLTNQDLERARLELGETEERKNISLQELKEKLSRDKDFNYRSDDKYLLRFLRYRKYNVEKAYLMMRKFYTLREERPDIFDLPPNFESLLKYGVTSCLPYTHQDGNVVLWSDTNKWKLDEMSFWESLNMGLATSDIITMNPSCQIHGMICLYDVNGMTARHYAQYAYPSLARTFARCMQEVYPWRIKQVIVINCNSIIRGFFRIFRHLMKKKIADRMILLGSDLSELHRYIDPCILPKVYGGSLENSQCSVSQLVLNNVPYLKYERSFGRILKP